MTDEQPKSYQQRRLDFINSGRPLPPKKLRKPIPKKSESRLKQESEEKQRRGDGDTELQKFFKSAMKRMVGRCAETGLVTETRIYQYAIRSICHILPRKKCPSVAYSQNNWVELDPGFHVKFDAMSWGEREGLGCWPVIRDRLVVVWPDLAEGERRHFPESVLEYMRKNKIF